MAKYVVIKYDNYGGQTTATPMLVDAPDKAKAIERAVQSSSHAEHIGLERVEVFFLSYVDWLKYATPTAAEASPARVLTVEEADAAANWKIRMFTAEDEASPAVEDDRKWDGSNRAVHLAHCNQGEYVGICKYGYEDCPATAAEEGKDGNG